jgi:hypothetical protein
LVSDIKGGTSTEGTVYTIVRILSSYRLRVFENRVLGRIFGSKRDEVTGDWRKLHNEALHKLYFLPSIIRMIKSRRMRWARNVARTGRRGTYRGYWWESQKGKDH